MAGLRGNVFAKNKNEQHWPDFENVKTDTVNNIINYNNEHWLLLANSGVIFHLKDGLLTHEQRPDGKAILDLSLIHI